jgi:glycosyltransferase involved in cell wall biosynthesis
MKLIIFPGNYVPHIGGLETHVDEFSKYYSKYAEITIFTPRVKNSKEKEIRHDKVKVIRYPAIEIINDYFIPNIFSSKFWKLYLNLKKEKFDWVMTRTLFFTNSTIGLIFAKCNKSKLIHVEHGSSYPKTSNPIVWIFSKLYLFFIGNIHTRLSHKIVCVSNESKKYINLFWKKCEVNVIYRGVDKNRIDKIKRKKLEKNSIVYAGRLIEGKGIIDLINATLKEKYTIYIIGEGSEINKLKEKAKISNSKIIFTGKLNYDKVISYMKGCEIVINPSYSEGLPTSILDSLYSNCKIIATDVGGTKEILNENWNKKGYRLIQPKNIDELNQAIKEVFKENKEKINLNKLNFDWEKHAEQYHKLI